MENALLVGLSRQVALRRELDIVANNLANLGTTGFKSEQVVFSEFLMPVARDETFPTTDRRLSYVQDKASWHDFAKGPAQVTGNPLDVMIDGDAFMAVQTPNGERYTRNGALQLDNLGRLVNTEGQPILTVGGPIAFGPEETDITIGHDGTISTSEGVRGRLRLVRFADPQNLKHQAGSLFEAEPGAAAEIPAGEVRVVQGTIEKSNVQPIVETTRMIEISRAYQSLATTMQRSEELRRTAIERLADVPA